MRRPTDGDAAYQLRLALRALRVCFRHVCLARLEAMPDSMRAKLHRIGVDLIGIDSPNVELMGLIRLANAHVRQLRAAKRKAET